MTGTVESINRKVELVSSQSGSLVRKKLSKELLTFVPSELKDNELILNEVISKNLLEHLNQNTIGLEKISNGITPLPEDAVVTCIIALTNGSAKPWQNGYNVTPVATELSAPVQVLSEPSDISGNSPSVARMFVTRNRLYVIGDGGLFKSYAIQQDGSLTGAIDHSALLIGASVEFDWYNVVPAIVDNKLYLSFGGYASDDAEDLTGVCSFDVLSDGTISGLNSTYLHSVGPNSVIKNTMDFIRNSIDNKLYSVIVSGASDSYVGNPSMFKYKDITSNKIVDVEDNTYNTVNNVFISDVRAVTSFIAGNNIYYVGETEPDNPGSSTIEVSMVQVMDPENGSISFETENHNLSYFIKDGTSVIDTKTSFITGPDGILMIGCVPHTDITRNSICSVSLNSNGIPTGSITKMFDVPVPQGSPDDFSYNMVAAKDSIYILVKPINSSGGSNFRIYRIETDGGVSDYSGYYNATNIDTTPPLSPYD